MTGEKSCLIECLIQDVVYFICYRWSVNILIICVTELTVW